MTITAPLFFESNFPLSALLNFVNKEFDEKNIFSRTFEKKKDFIHILS
jgi:hypothetical protein